MGKKTSIADRIRQNYTLGITYHELMRLVFPEDLYPNAYRYQSNGGPPGCAMAFGKALRKLNMSRDFNSQRIYEN